mgnify:CR=1 FL=1
MLLVSLFISILDSPGLSSLGFMFTFEPFLTLLLIFASVSSRLVSTLLFLVESIYFCLDSLDSLLGFL